MTPERTRGITMGELPIIVEGNIDDSDEELIARVNTWLSDILGEPGSLTVDRITRVTEEIQDGVKEPGFVCVWID